MQVTVGNQLRIENPSEQLLAWCKKQLILPNPEYAKKVRMHFWVGNTPEKLYLFQWDGDTLVLPYGCLNDVLAMDDCHMKVNLPTPTEVDFGCTIPLYDYQVEAKEALITAYYGILQAPAGCGKTQIGIAVAADTGRRTLWLTHTRDLLVQSKSRAEQYMSPSLTGTITEGRVQIGKAITFATVQTMCNLDLSQYRDVWDCIIVDECHRVAGTPTAMTQFSKVLNALAARHKYGLSATVHRADGMSAATYALLGGIALITAYYGILQAPAGCGKTQIGIAVAADTGRRTLWLTHTRDLLVQSKSRAEQYMSPSLTGTITEGRVQIGKAITFATVQTMCNLDLSQYRDVWDCIIVDECHRVAGTPTAMTQFSKVLNALAARHKYGLSATVHRADGMSAATYALLGGIAYQVPEEAVKDKIMTVSVLPRATHQGLSREFLDTDGTIIYAKLVNFLADRYDRNELIAADLVENQDHYNLILSDRLNHLEYLMNHLPRQLREQAVMIDGKMTTKKAKALREQAIEEMRQGRKRYLFATYSLAKEGLDIPRLDRLYLTTPQKDYAVITQSIGRIARTFEGKGEPIAYDYVDDGIQYLVRSYKKRCTTYRKCGCKFIEQEVSK